MTESHDSVDPSRRGASAAGAIDPTGAGDAQLAESYAALSHLLAAAATPVDVTALSTRIAARIEQRARSRRRVRFAGAGLALAASIALIVGAWTWMPRGDGQKTVAQNTAATPEETSAAPAIVAGPANAVAPDAVGTVATENALPESANTVPAWNDELADEIAEVVNQAELVECRWREAPDEIALFQSQVDDFAQDVIGNEPASTTNDEQEIGNR